MTDTPPTPEPLDQRIRQMIVAALLNDRTVLGPVTINTDAFPRYMQVELSFRTPKDPT